ncbi:hypothetical protein VTI74DRAFT_4788 [Chaetomium olivicolor]
MPLQRVLNENAASNQTIFTCRTTGTSAAIISKQDIVQCLNEKPGVNVNIEQVRSRLKQWGTKSLIACPDP